MEGNILDAPEIDIKKYFFITLATTIGLLTLSLALRFSKNPAVPVSYYIEPVEPPMPAGIEITAPVLKNCMDKRLRIKFLCDYGWNEVDVNEDTAYFHISSDPSVRFKIVKINTDILYIEQLSREKIKAIGHYKEGFVTENVKVAGLKAIKVKAFANNDPQTRLADYYFVRNEKLYAMMFSVNPKDKWSHYQFAFLDIVKSLRFY